jgi:hypothetical protein
VRLRTKGSSLAMAIVVLRCWDEWRMAEPFGDNQGHSDGRGAGMVLVAIGIIWLVRR